MREGFLHRHGGNLSRLLRVFDAVVPALLFLSIPDWSVSEIPKEWVLLCTVFVGILTAITFHAGNLYVTYRQKSLASLLARLTLQWLMVISALLLLAFATKVTNYLSRVDFSAWAFAVWLVLVGLHVGGRMMLRVYRSYGGNTRRLLFWGSPETACRVFREFQANPQLGLSLRAWFSPSITAELSLPEGMPLAQGGFMDMKCWLQDNQIDMIFFDHPSKESPAKELLGLFGDTCKPVHYIPEWALPSMCFHVEQLGSTFCIGLWGRQPALIDLQVKRLLDIIVSLVLIGLFSPIMLIISGLIKLTSPGPLVYRQDRYGLDGKRFKILKFRTMHVLESGDQPGLRQARRNDPRVTAVGRILRRWSLDELPQLFNVLAGSMSLVGPRPHAVDHNEFYRTRIPGYMERHLCKPGITGLAQVDGWRGETAELRSMEKRIEADLRYQRDWSLLLDLEIFIKTIFCIRSPNAF